MNAPKPSAPDTLDDFSPMSESELRKQVDRPSNQPPPGDDPPPTLSLPEAQKKLNAKVQALLSADAKTLPNLMIEIQTLRVVCMLLSEASEDGKTAFDPNTYREMSMLNRMLAKGGMGEGEDDPAGALADLTLEAEAEERLARRGISRDGAARMARVLGAALSRAGAPANAHNVAPPDDDDEGDEPDMAPEVVQ